MTDLCKSISPKVATVRSQKDSTMGSRIILASNNVRTATMSTRTNARIQKVGRQGWAPVTVCWCVGSVPKYVWVVVVWCRSGVVSQSGVWTVLGPVGCGGVEVGFGVVEKGWCGEAL